jgi:hypothetical protein
MTNNRRTNLNLGESQWIFCTESESNHQLGPGNGSAARSAGTSNKEVTTPLFSFKHEGWKEPVEFMHHCSTKWAVFLLSLKSLVETGKGAPDPNDIKIDNWN